MIILIIHDNNKSIYEQLVRHYGGTVVSYYNPLVTHIVCAHECPALTAILQLIHAYIESRSDAERLLMSEYLRDSSSPLPDGQRPQLPVPVTVTPHWLLACVRGCKALPVAPFVFSPASLPPVASPRAHIRTHVHASMADDSRSRACWQHTIGEALDASGWRRYTPAVTVSDSLPCY